MCNWASHNLSLDEVIKRIDEQLEQGEERTTPREQQSLWEEWGTSPIRWELSTAQDWYRAAAQYIYEFQYDSPNNQC